MKVCLLFLLFAIGAITGSEESSDEDSSSNGLAHGLLLSPLGLVDTDALPIEQIVDGATETGPFPQVKVGPITVNKPPVPKLLETPPIVFHPMFIKPQKRRIKRRRITTPLFDPMSPYSMRKYHYRTFPYPIPAKSKRNRKLPVEPQFQNRALSNFDNLIDPYYRFYSPEAGSGPSTFQEFTVDPDPVKPSQTFTEDRLKAMNEVLDTKNTIDTLFNIRDRLDESTNFLTQMKLESRERIKKNNDLLQRIKKLIPI